MKLANMPGRELCHEKASTRPKVNVMKGMRSKVGTMWVSLMGIA